MKFLLGLRRLLRLDQQLPFQAEWPGPKSDSSVGQRIARLKLPFLSHRWFPQIGSVFVMQVVTDDDRPLQTFGRMIGQDVE